MLGKTNDHHRRVRETRIALDQLRGGDCLLAATSATASSGSGRAHQSLACSDGPPSTLGGYRSLSGVGTTQSAPVSRLARKAAMSAL